MASMYIVYSLQYTGSVRVQVTFAYCKNVKDKIRNVSFDLDFIVVYM